MIDMVGKPGSAMQKLNERQQAFVLAAMANGGRNYAQAAREAGFSDEGGSAKATAYRLSHDPKIQAALMEEANRRLNTGSVLAVSVLLELVNGDSLDPKDRLKAIELVLNRTGMHAKSEHKVEVKHTDETSKEMVERIKLLSAQMGIDSQKLLGNCVVEGEYEEVENVEDDLSDIY